MTEPRVPEEAARALAQVVAMQQSGGMWHHYTGATRELLIENYLPTANEALAAALPHIACSCFVISDVNDYCPQHGRDS